MKRFFKLFGIIALVAVIGFFALPLTGCSADNDDGGGTSTGGGGNNGGDTGGDGGGSGINYEEMVTISAGTFLMGSPDTESGSVNIEHPQHSVTLSGFKICKYEVTQAQYRAVMGAGEDRTDPSRGKGDNYPIYCVSWYDALVFCNKLSVMKGLDPAYSISGSTDPADWGTVPTTGNLAWEAVVIVAGSTGYRLPTEAQWEYACRAGTTTAYNTGDTITTNTGWYQSNSGSKTHQVGLKPANEWGLYDMHGNVKEWCWDRYGDYSSSPTNDPMGAFSGTTRVVRGGSWISSANDLRSAYRGNVSSFDRVGNYSLGFRIVLP